MMNSPEFNDWLDDHFCIDRKAEPPSFGCTRCGISPRVDDFIGEYCIVCLAEIYGQFTKSRDIALWIEANGWMWERGNVDEKTAAIYILGPD